MDAKGSARRLPHTRGVRFSLFAQETAVVLREVHVFPAAVPREVFPRVLLQELPTSVRRFPAPASRVLNDHVASWGHKGRV